MKWIGQHIWDFISRFRNDVYLENLSETTQDHVVSIDANGKLYKQDVAAGDITGVTITTDSGGGSAASDTGGSADFSILGANGVGVTNSGTTITAAAVPGEIDHDSLLNFTSMEHFTQEDITTVGTISTGVWQGTAIGSAYMTSATASVRGVVELATTAEVTTGTDTVRVVTPDGLKDGYQGSANIDTVGTISTGTWRGTAIEHDSIGADAIDGDNIADDSINSEHYVDGSIDTAHIADDQVTFAKASGVTPKVYGSVIKLIPSDFMDNGDGGNTKFGVAYTDVAGTGYGMRPPNNATELYAFVSIPEGMKATHVDIFDKNDLAIEVFEAHINATTMTSKGTGNCNTTLDITDVNSSATNFLAIEVTTTSVNDRIYGGQVTIAAI